MTVTINSLPMKWPDGHEVQAGDLKTGQWIEINLVSGQIKKIAAPTARSSAVERRALVPDVAGSNPAAPAKKSKYKDPEKRKIYMRNLMRKRREAARKAKQ